MTGAAYDVAVDDERAPNRPNERRRRRRVARMARVQVSDDVWSEFRAVAGNRPISEVLGELVTRESCRASCAGAELVLREKLVTAHPAGGKYG